MELNFGHIEIFAKDPLKAKDFYINIMGYELETIQQEKFVWLKKDNSVILLRPGSKELQVESYSSSKTGFVVYTDDLNAAVAALKGRGLAFKGTDGSERCLTFTDDDGNWFQLVNPGEH